MQDHPIILDTSQNGIQQTLTGFYCGDSGEKRFCITLMHQNSVYTPQTGILAMCGKKPDGTHFLHPCTVSGSQVYYLPTAQTFAAPGTVECQLIVYGENGSVLYAPRFAIEVEEPLEPCEGLVSADEWTLLPVQVLAGLSGENNTLTLDGEFVGAVALAETFDSLPTGVCGQFAFVQTGDAGHASGFYRFGTQWEHLSVAEHAHTNLETLEQLTASHIHTHANKTALDSVTADVVLSSHTHTNAAALAQVEAANLHSHANKTVLDKFSEANGVPKYDGAAIVVEAHDTLETLELNTAYDTLLVRPDWADVPVYNITSNETVAELCDIGDQIVRLVYLIDEVTGMPCPELYIKTGGVSYVCLSATYHDIGSVTRQAGWYTVDDMEYISTTPPTIANMTFTTLEVAKEENNTPDAYYDLSNLPAKAQCALETLCRMVNVSVDAMGGLGVKTDGVQRLVNAPQAGKRYAFATGADMTFPLPAIEWTGAEREFWVDLNCTSAINLTFSDTVRYANGGNVDTSQGQHRLLFYVFDGDNKWTVAETESVIEVTEDILPDYAIPFHSIYADQLRAVLKYGYKNSDGAWCVRIGGIETVFFQVGDTRPVTLTDGREVTMRIIGIEHDDLPYGGKAALTCDFKEVISVTSFQKGATTTYDQSKLRNVSKTIVNLFPSWLYDLTVCAKKQCCQINTSNNSYVSHAEITTDKTWALSYSEVGLAQSEIEHDGTPYAVFTDNVSRFRYLNDTRKAWLIRTGTTMGNRAMTIATNGTMALVDWSDYADVVAVGFCLNA